MLLGGIMWLALLHVKFLLMLRGSSLIRSAISEQVTIHFFSRGWINPVPNVIYFKNCPRWKYWESNTWPDDCIWQPAREALMFTYTSKFLTFTNLYCRLNDEYVTTKRTRVWDRGYKCFNWNLGVYLNRSSRFIKNIKFTWLIVPFPVKKDMLIKYL